MEAEKENFRITMMARLLHVSRSGYYSWKRRGGATDPYAALKVKIKAIWESSHRRYGARTIHAELSKEATLYRVRKCMKELGISGMTPKVRRQTTIPDKTAKNRPDLIRRRFAWPVATTASVGDITYLKTGEGWLYLATVIDLSTRMVIGWAFSRSLATPFVIKALEMAKSRGYLADGAIFHSDRGCQYTSKMLAEWAKAHDVRLSVGRTGSCHDNAVAESFFATLKNEMYFQQSFATRDEAKTAVIDYIERYYNRFRLHSSIGYQAPAYAMEAFMARCDKAFSEGIEEAKIAA